MVVMLIFQLVFIPRGLWRHLLLRRIRTTRRDILLFLLQFGDEETSEQMIYFKVLCCIFTLCHAILSAVEEVTRFLT